MARGFGRSLDLVTLLVLLRHKLQQEDGHTFSLRFDIEHGFCSWIGRREPDDVKFYKSIDSALLALLIGEEHVPGVDE